MARAAKSPSPGAFEQSSPSSAHAPSAGDSTTTARSCIAPVVIILAGLAGAWIAAGSIGLLAHSLRHALTWAALGAAIVAGWPERARSIRAATTAVAILAVIVMNLSSSPVVNALSAAVVLGLLSVGRPVVERRALCAVASAIVVFGVYRLAITSVPWLWLVTDGTAGLMGRLASAIAGQPLAAGATFAGLDFLVLMAALCVGWLFLTPAPIARRAGYAVPAILGGHLVYLVVLAWVPAGLEWLGDEATDSLLGGLARTLLPWNTPALAAVIHLLIVAAMFRWSVDFNAPDDAVPGRRRNSRLTVVLAGGLAVLAAATATLHAQPLSLSGKKVVAYKEGFLNWLKPVHGEYGRLSVGMYGMLESYVTSLGGEFSISPELSQEDLDRADVLILLYPNKPWKPGQSERIWSFVRGGGSLLLMGDHTTRDSDVPLAEGGNYFNQLLQPTHMRVRFDSATFAVGGWLQTYEALAHPTTAGLADDRNQFGIVIGSSVEARWPARPLIMGRYGWADPGDEGSDAAMMGNHRYDAGESLGDLVLAAEEPVGRGKVIVFGDTSSMTNGINVGAHVFTSRLLGYLASGRTAVPAWRQLLLIALAAGLVFAIARSASAWCVLVVSIAMAVTLGVCTTATARAATILPDGRFARPNNLAYIDTSHLPANSEESWREDGLGGLGLTLMRNGFLVLNMETFSSARLARAGLLIIVAPSRAYTAAEQEAIHRFVEDGGTVICTVGYDRSAASRELLRRFGLYVGLPERGARDADPEPMGHFKSPFIKVDNYMAHVRFHAAWPVGSYEPDARVIAYGSGDLPVILARQVGQGWFVLVGDTCFAMNKNLEREGGEPFEGMRENADFWRWLLADLTGRPQWLPSDPATQPAN